MASQVRHPQLDSLRAFSVIIVVFVHTMNPKGPVFSSFAPLAVAMFFVLSGFLITGILFDARERAEAAGVARGSVLGKFYARRFLRIFPIYYAVLGVAVLLGEQSTRSYLWELVTYRQNFLLARLGHNVPPITPLWSLAVEEHFYVVWPLIVLFASRRYIWVASMVMVVGSLVARSLLWDTNYQLLTMPTYAAVDSIAVGCMLALLWRGTTTAERKPWLRGALIVGLTLEATRQGLSLYPLPHSVPLVRVMNTLPFGIACVWLIGRGAEERLPAWMSNRWLAKLGLVSYAVYVVHRYVMHFLGYDYQRGLHVFFPVLAISVLIASVSWIVFEGPINNLKRYFPYVKRSAPASAGVPVTAEV
ncbi:MAG: acyltransferase [bacterium]